MSVQSTPKGDAFCRYFFIDRGAEKDLSMEEALDDFEKFIYSPIHNFVVTEVVTGVVEEAFKMTVGSEDEDFENLGEDDVFEVAKFIGLGFLAAYRDRYIDAVDEN